ncbi:hypothetical protein ACFJIW_09395 [Tahibacter sp. UC22_41]|uniref:hypothetical protein n=1 Tax=Tahibacter sp. UC22_41 TaxID=3350178 RepID=UPI0036D989FF
MTSKLRFLPRIAALALASAACFPSGAFAQANVDVNITISNGITILYYYSALDITLNSASLAGLLTTGCTAGALADTYYCNRGNPGGVTATAAAGTLTASFTGPTGPGGLNTAAVPLVLSNVWSVRAVGGSSANTTVQISRGANNTLNNGTASIGINDNYGIATGATAALTGASPQAATFADPGLGGLTTGSVVLELDLTNATTTGAYSSTAGNVNYVLTVTAT